MSEQSVFKVYFAGELFSLKHLLGNAAMAAELQRVSNGRYQSVLPQDLEQRETTAESIRNQDIKALIECDVALFNFDGNEVDSGTVVEYMFAKFCDIPSVIVRTDFRSGGDQRGDPWNLMLSFYPRTKVILADAMGVYQKHLQRQDATLEQSVQAAIAASKEMAEEICSAFDEVISRPSQLTPELREPVYKWLRLLAGDSFSETLSAANIEELLEKKVSNQLI